MAKISRDVLKQFLPNHETIVAFEKLLTFMDDTAPTQLEEILVLVSSIKRVNVAEINSRLETMEVPLSRGRNMSAIESRLDELNSMPARSENLRDIMTRIEKIETFLGI